MPYHISWVNKPMQPAPGRPGLHSGLDSFPATRTAHCPLQAAIYGVISAFLWRSASKYGNVQPGHCAVPVRSRRSLLCSQGVEFGSKRFTNQVQTQTHRRRLHQKERLPVPRLTHPGRRQMARICPHRPRVVCWRVLGPRGTIPRARLR
jgi:hypothetical protein